MIQAAGNRKSHYAFLTHRRFVREGSMENVPAATSRSASVPAPGQAATAASDTGFSTAKRAYQTEHRYDNYDETFRYVTKKLFVTFEHAVILIQHACVRARMCDFFFSFVLVSMNQVIANNSSSYSPRSFLLHKIVSHIEIGRTSFWNSEEDLLEIALHVVCIPCNKFE